MTSLNETLLLEVMRGQAQIISSQAEHLRIFEEALESERQWRLKSLPALLAAEAKAARCSCDSSLTGSVRP